MSGQVIQFNTGHVTQTHTVLISDDDECEMDPNENFFSNIVLETEIPEIFVTVPRATVSIDDSGVADCGRFDSGTNLAL